MFSKPGLAGRRFLWTVATIASMLLFGFWIFSGVVTLTRSIPGWTVWDWQDNHAFMLSYAIAGGGLVGAILLLGSLFAYDTSRGKGKEDEEQRTYPMLSLVLYIITQLMAYLVGLAFAWGYDSRFGNSNPFGGSFSTQLYWVSFNFGVLVVSLFGFLTNFQAVLQYALAFPTS